MRLRVDMEQAVRGPRAYRAYAEAWWATWLVAASPSADERSDALPYADGHGQNCVRAMIPCSGVAESRCAPGSLVGLPR